MGTAHMIKRRQKENCQIYSLRKWKDGVAIYCNGQDRGGSILKKISVQFGHVKYEMLIDIQVEIK